MAFSKKKVDERKDWLRSYVPGTFLDHTADTISYHEFVHKELILFSRADLERSIPSMVDGLKPGQRKIMYACFKRNLRSDIKVAQLAGYIAEHSAYHHGEASLASTILGLAQDFVGSNNISYLVPQGQFGTRLQGGKDAASPRYVFTRLANLTRHLFNESDDKLLNYLNEEGQSIEPEWYVPILPSVLLNGAEGIGTGWSTSIPNYNPKDVVDNIKCLLNGEEMFAMDPWYRGYNGTIEEVVSTKGVRSYVVNGVINQIDDTTLEITELPVRKWTQDYKEFLEELARPEDKNATPFITDYKEHHTDSTVRFVVTLPEAKMREALATGLHAKFKLTSKIAISNMMLFGPDGIIRRYEGPEDIIREFFPLRMEYYVKRRAALLRAAEAELTRISNRVRFILAVVGGKLKLSNRRRSDIEKDLEADGYDRLKSQKKVESEESSEEGGESDQGTYEYLLSMSLSSLTLEKVQALKAEAQEKEAEVVTLRNTTEADMWRADLDNLVAAYDEFEIEEARKEASLSHQQAKARKADAKRDNKGKKGAKGKAKGKKKAAWSDDESELSDDDFSDEDDFVPIKRPAAAQAAKPRRPAPPARPAISEPSSMAVAAGGGAKRGAAKQPREPSPPPAEEEMSLMQRMAMRMGDLQLDSKGSEMSASIGLAAVPALAKPKAKAKTAPKAVPAVSRPARVAASKKVVVDSDSDEEESDFDSGSEDEFDISDDGSEVNSPTPMPRKVVSKVRGPSNLGEKRSNPEAQKTAGVVTSEASDLEIDLAESSGEESEAPATAAKPVSKVQRIRPSPFHKGSGKPATTKAAPKAKAAPKPRAAAAKPKAAPKSKARKAEDSDDDEDVVVLDASPEPLPKAKPAPRRAAAAVAKPKYVDESDFSGSESDEDDYMPSD